jgi:hypothetical protein
MEAWRGGSLWILRSARLALDSDNTAAQPSAINEFADLDYHG